MNDLDRFVGHLATKRLTQVDLAVALIWFHEHEKATECMDVRDVANTLRQKGLCGQINLSRLKNHLKKRRELVRGNKDGQFRIRAGDRQRLDEKYTGFLTRPRVKESDSLIPRDQFESQRKPWRDLVAEINGCYDHGFYDAVAVLCRRIVEALIVEVFKKRNATAEISNSGGDYLMMDGLINAIKSRKTIRLSKSAQPTLLPIKELGDTAAHSPHHITTKQDIDNQANRIRRLVSELLNILDES